MAQPLDDETRIAFVILRKYGHCVNDTCKRLKVTSKTVYEVVKKYNATSSIKTDPGSGAKRTKKTMVNQKHLRGLIHRKNDRSLGECAKVMSLKKTMTKRLAKDTDFSSKTFLCQHLITSARKEKRLARSNGLLNRMGDDSNANKGHRMV